MSAHRLGLADAVQAARRLRDEGEGDGEHDPRLVKGARRESHQIVHRRHLVEDGESAEDDRQGEAIRRTKDECFQCHRPAQQREPIGQAKEHRVAQVSGQAVEQSGQRNRHRCEAKRSKGRPPVPHRRAGNAHHHSDQ